jgi:hypothetical protein
MTWLAVWTKPPLLILASFGIRSRIGIVDFNEPKSARLIFTHQQCGKGAGLQG